ncbi:class I SAM-dependent methyltransferase [Desulfonatronum parangueonense]
MLKTSIPGLDRDLLQDLTRSELERLGVSQKHLASEDGPAPELAPVPLPPPGTTPPPATLPDLLALNGQEFLDHAWTALTGTRPDPTRLAAYMEAMQSGELHKVEVLDAIRRTPEGRAAAVPLPGLRRRLLPFHIARLPLLGPLLRWCAAMYRLPENWKRMNILWARRDVPPDSAPVDQEILLLRRELQAARIRIEDLERRNAPTSSLLGLDGLYLDFENTFRGPREEIKQRLAVYLPYLNRIKAGTADAPVLDIGCGRGEWLELLRDQGLRASGVDLNPASAALCRELGQDVRVGDALDHLHGLPPGSLGAVTAFHLIEHLPLEAIVALLDAAHRALVPGGALILETPNPENLLVGACSFHRDPTHLRPIHPETAFFLLSRRGYQRVYWTGLHPFVHQDMGQVPDGFLRRMFFAPQDYMIVGYK